MYIGDPKFLNSLLVMKKLIGEPNDALDKKIHQEKIGLRNLYRLKEKNRDGWEYHFNEIDRCCGKKIYDYEMSSQEIDDYIKSHWIKWYNPYNDGRDCTGVWFTRSIRCFPVNGKTIVYHFQNCDI